MGGGKYINLPYLPEPSYIYSPANHCIVLKKKLFNEISGPVFFAGEVGVGGTFALFL